MKNSDVIKTDNYAQSHYAYNLLKTGFVVAPFVAGLDKFFNYLTDWTKYLAPPFYELLNLSPSLFMQGVGVIEIIVAVGVLLKPRIFAYVVCAWLAGIVLNLLILGQYWDIALRDVGLAIGAFALGKLAPQFEVGQIEERRTISAGHRTLRGRV